MVSFLVGSGGNPCLETAADGLSVHHCHLESTAGYCGLPMPQTSSWFHGHSFSAGNPEHDMFRNSKGNSKSTTPQSQGCQELWAERLMPEKHKGSAKSGLSGQLSRWQEDNRSGKPTQGWILVAPYSQVDLPTLESQHSTIVQ